MRTSILLISSFLLLFSSKICISGNESALPRELRCEFLEHPYKTIITDPRPEFSWIISSRLNGDYQTAYQLLVASSHLNIINNTGDMWDSGKVTAANSASVEYRGKPLLPEKDYWWKVKVWDKNNQEGKFSGSQLIRTGDFNKADIAARYTLVHHTVVPVSIIRKSKGHYFFDFGKTAFGTVSFQLLAHTTGNPIEIRLGEKLSSRNTIDTQPPGSVRYRSIILTPGESDQSAILVPISPDVLNTGKNSIQMPDYTGEVMPFRYCEIITGNSSLDIPTVRMIAVHYPFKDDASHFSSSNSVLNDIWELCKYSIKATSYTGVYVDGDRERIPYEADAYITLLGHYNVDSEFTIGRYSHEYLLHHPTWPTEWNMLSVFNAWTDYLYTGNEESIRAHYEDLKAKTLIALARDDGLISTRTGLMTESFLSSIHRRKEIRDIVDWPKSNIESGFAGEQDGYVFTDINTTVNAFHFKALQLMSKIARALDQKDDAALFAKKALLVKESINAKLFDPVNKRYLDGEGTTHSSLHANMFPLAFGIVPTEFIPGVVKYIKQKGMACSVYGAQFLLEGLFQTDEDEYAIELMTARNDRSWAHMIYDLNTTITPEAWDRKYKPNLDWNHAWGTAPANIIPRFIMGIRPTGPGFKTFTVKPRTGNVSQASMKLPTIKGNITLSFTTDQSSFFSMNLHVRSIVQPVSLFHG